jgi:energy-converting hydrogenase Eha subunit H
MNLINPYSIISFVLLIVFLILRAIKKTNAELSEETDVIDHLKHDTTPKTDSEKELIDCGFGTCLKEKEKRLDNETQK